jgi:hypothetical protein
LDSKQREVQATNNEIRRIVNESLTDLRESLTACVNSTVQELRNEMQNTCGNVGVKTQTNQRQITMIVAICAGLLALSMLTGTLVGRLAYSRFLDRIGEVQTMQDGRKYLIPDRVAKDTKDRIAIPLED